MRLLYTFLLLIFLSVIVNAQTKTWVGANGASWADPNNWSPSGVPTSNTNAIIPSGSVVHIDVTSNSNVDTLTVQNGASINKSNTGYLSINGIGYFQAGSVLNLEESWIYGDLIFDGTINCIGPLVKGHYNGTLEMNGTMNLQVGGANFEMQSNTLLIGPNGTLNIMDDGIFDLAAWTATVENQGLIQKTGGTGDFEIQVVFENNGGTIEVSSGSLLLIGSNTLTNGMYNASAGASIIAKNSANVNGTLTGQLDGPLVFEGAISPTQGGVATFDFTGSAQVEWAGGQISSGNLINDGYISITGTSSLLNIINAVSLTNNGTIDVTSKLVRLGNGAELTNSPSGTIHLLDSVVFDGFFSPVGIRNQGMITQAANGKNKFIRTALLNEGGSIDVAGDTLYLANSATVLTGGQIDVSTGGAISIIDGPAIAGTFTGQLDGPIMFINQNIELPTPDTAVFNFTGSAQVQWRGGSFNGGNLHNMSTIHALGDFAPIPMQNGTQFINDGTFNLNSSGNLILNGATTTFTNTVMGTLDIQSDVDIVFGAATIINQGLIVKTGGTGNSDIYPLLYHDDPGMIRAETGGIVLQNAQAGNGDFSGAGALWLGNGFVVEGDVYPGNSPGTLNILSDYTSSSTSVLHIELDGPTAGTDYDVLAIGNDAILKGDINVTMGYAAAVNDQFEIITATNVDSCLLPATVTTNYNGDTYTFDVICNPDNVTLGVISVGVTELEKNPYITVFPNPAQHSTSVLFKTKNVTGTTNLALYNNIGLVVNEWSLNNTSGRLEIQRGDLPTGIYYLKVYATGAFVQTTKIIFE